MAKPYPFPRKAVVPSAPPTRHWRTCTFWGFFVECLAPDSRDTARYGVFSANGTLLARAHSWKRATDYALTLRKEQP